MNPRGGFFAARTVDGYELGQVLTTLMVRPERGLYGAVVYRGPAPRTPLRELEIDALFPGEQLAPDPRSETASSRVTISAGTTATRLCDFVL